MSDTINPTHYITYPEGVHAECIEYTRVMAFSQGNAFKYIYRCGQKDAPLQELRKAAWYLNDCLSHGPVGMYAQFLATPKITPSAGWAAQVLYYIACGAIAKALTHVLEEINRLEDQ